LLAAGAAAGTLAADRAKGAMARARLSDSEGLVPREREIEALFLDELGEARLAVERLSGTPTGLGMPGLEQARQRAEEAVEEARGELVEKELLHSADHAVHPYARIAADAPVYALLAWVVLHAGMVLLGMKSEFTDFLISSLLLAAVYLFVLRVLVRRRLGSRVEALIAGGVESARKTLAGWAEELGDGVDRACEAPVQALDRLASLGQRWRASIEALERPAANSGTSEAESLD